MHSIPQPATAGTRPYKRALAKSQGYHWAEVRADNDGEEQLVLQAQHDQVSDAYHKQADDEEDLALEAHDPRHKDAHIRASKVYRLEAYRFEALEDERRDQAITALHEARDAGLAGSETCELVLRRTGIDCGNRAGHGRAA